MSQTPKPKKNLVKGLLSDVEYLSFKARAKSLSVSQSDLVRTAIVRLLQEQIVGIETMFIPVQDDLHTRTASIVEKTQLVNPQTDSPSPIVSPETQRLLELMTPAGQAPLIESARASELFDILDAGEPSKGGDDDPAV